MNINILIAISINLGVLLIASWGFGAFFIGRIIKEKHALEEQLNALGSPNNQHATDPTPPTDSYDIPTPIPINEENADYTELLDEMAKEIQEKEDRINRLLEMKASQQNTHQFLKTMDSNDDMSRYIDQLEADFKETEQIIIELQRDLDSNRRSMAQMEQQIIAGEGLSTRISALERSERKLRDENKTLRNNGIKIAEKLDTRNNQITHLKKSNDNLKKTIRSLNMASKEQLVFIKKLQAQVDRAEKLEAHQRRMIEELEEKQASERDNGNDQEKIDQMERELEELRDVLKRTLIEKEFIEEHMVELDDSLEKAKEIEEALEKAKQEIATLEQSVPSYQPELEPLPDEEAIETAEPTPTFTSDIPEVNLLMENNRLFGSIQEFWMTLDLPPLAQVETTPLPKPEIEKWVYLSIGNNDYGVLLTIEESLAEIVTESIFKENQDDNSKQALNDTCGELGNIIAGTLATELNNDFPVSVPEHINYAQAQDYFNTAAIVSEVMLLSKQQPIYAALIVPTDNAQ